MSCHLAIVDDMSSEMSCHLGVVDDMSLEMSCRLGIVDNMSLKFYVISPHPAKTDIVHPWCACVCASKILLDFGDPLL